MTRRLVLSYVTITLLVLALLEIPLGVVFARSERRNLVSELKHDALALGALSEETLEGSERSDLQKLVRDYQIQTDGRVIITDRKGVLVADSSVRRVDRQSYASRPEIAAALDGRETTGTRRSDTLNTDLLYIAVPVSSGGDVEGAVRITYTPTEINRRVQRGWLVLTAVGLTVLAATSLLSMVLARSVSRPLRRLERAASGLAEGKLGTRADPTGGPKEVGAVAEAFNTMAARLEQLVRSQQEFVADASHQLRTPLQALRLRLENAEVAADDEVRRDLHAALGEVARLGRLVEGLLVLARAEAEATSAAPINVAAVASARRDAWDALAHERGVELRIDPVPRGLRALATPGHLEQSLDNLISNALDASPPGTAIELAARRSNGWVEVHVIDRGPGMTREQRARAADRFWRPADAKQGGSGLGLAIVHRLSTLDGGELDLRNASDGGLDAVIRLRPATRN